MMLRLGAYTISQVNPLPLRLILPDEGEGKCAVQHSVSVSQKRSRKLRRVTPACFGSTSNFGDSSG